MSKTLSWDDQRAFLAVLEHGSLSAAARELGVAQPTVRSRVEALETALGTSLFTRTANGLIPTESARALGGPARAMAHASELFVRSASAPPGEFAGTVRVSVSDFIGIEVMPAMLAQIRRTRPHISIELVLSNSPADIPGQEVDIAVRMSPLRQGSLVARKVGSIPLGFFASTDYVAAHGLPRSMAELSAHDLIGPDRARTDLETAASLSTDFDRARFVLRTDSHPAQAAAARAGVGIAVMQVPVGLRDPVLVPVLPELTVASLDTWIVTHDDLRHVPRVRVVFDELVAAFGAFLQTE